MPVPSYAQGSGGFVNFGAGTLAMLHGYEAVVPRGQAQQGLSQAQAAVPSTPNPAQAPAPAITIHIQALDPVGLKKVVEAEVAPLLVSAYRRNVNGLRTETRRELVE